jgi:DivIVA domain-containing protein
MPSEVTPDGIRGAEFRTTLRGLDRAEVASFLEAVAGRVEQLEGVVEKLKTQLDESSGPDLGAEFEKVGNEVAAILQAAREAAESMRERASIDAARWRREAAEEAETLRREAAADSEALRRDAWVTGSELLDQAQVHAEAMRAAAERDVLTVMGEAEREAHRLTSGARREAEDLVRNANMEAEKITADAVKRRDEIIDGANRQAATAQERARALENRRDELLEELENVRATLTKLEGSLEERREALDLTTAPEPSSVRVVHPPAEAKEQWELGETVRVVHPDQTARTDPDAVMADEVSDQVARIQRSEPDPSLDQSEPATPPVEPEREPSRPVESRPEAKSEPEPEPESELMGEADTGDDVGALFAALRGGADTAPDTGLPEEAVTEEAVREESGGDESSDEGGTDWIAVRDSKLLPITNRALRGVKKSMTEVQNVALDNLRTEGGWEPDPGAIAESVHAELVGVWTESFAVGHAVAEEMAGSKLKRPSTPASKADAEFASDLAAAVTSALESAGEGPRERQSAASRVFRVWRSDEAERRIRDIAILGYETGIEQSRRVPTG